MFNTRRIPFGTRIRVVATFAVPAGVGIQSFFVIIRGLEWLEPATFPGAISALHESVMTAICLAF